MAERAKRKKVSVYFREIKNELKKVIWPNRKQLTTKTITVLAVCLVIGLIVWVFDLLVGQGIIINLLKR